MHMTREFHDPADSIHASHWPDMADALDGPEDRLAEAIASGDPAAVADHIRAEVRAGVADKIASALMFVLADLDTDDNPALGIQCCLYAINRNPDSETRIARRFGVTRAAVSKRIVRFCERLALPEARGMKKAEARDTYRLRQKEVARARPRRDGAWRMTSLFGCEVATRPN